MFAKPLNLNAKLYVSNLTSSSQVTSGAVTTANLTAGKFALLNNAGAIIADISGLGAGDTYRIAINELGTIRISDPIQKGSIIASTKNVAAKADAAEKVQYLGYNGTTGDFESGVTLTAGTDYVIQTLLLSNGHSSPGYPFWKAAAAYRTTTTSKVDLCNGIYKSLLANFEREKTNEEFIKFERVCSNAGSAIGAAADTVVGSKGTIFVTVTDVAANASVNAIAAGDYFRVGTGVTDPVYKVVASTVGTGGGLLTLDTPLQSDVNLVGNTSEFVAAANVAAASWGIKLTGVPRKFRAGVYKYQKADWKLDLTSGFTATIITDSVAATYGVGTKEQISELEYELHDTDRIGIVLTVPPKKFRENVTLGGFQTDGTYTGVYYLLQFDFLTPAKASLVNYQGQSRNTIMLACGEDLTTFSGLLS
jgi:hypothetical protein